MIRLLPTHVRGAWYAILPLLFGSFTAMAQTTAPLTVQADDTSVLSLEELVRQVRTANPSLQAARLAAAGMATHPEQVSSLPDPSFSFSYRPFAIGGVEGIAPARLGIQQMVPFPGKLALAGEAAQEGAAMSKHQASAMELDLVYKVKVAYYELFRVQEQDRLIDAFQRQLDDFEDAAAAKYEVGAGMQQAILKAQLERNALSRRRLNLAAMRRTLVERLARLTDRPALAAERGAFVLARPPAGQPDVPGPAGALVERPEVQALQAGLRQSDAQIALAKKAYLPDFMLGAGLMDMMTMGQPVHPLDNLGNRLGIQAGIVLPLQRGRRDAALKEARLRKQQMQARFDALQTEIQTDFNDQKTRLQEDGEALALYESTLVPQAETTLDATLSAYTTGRTDFLDLLDAERMLFNLKMDYETTYASFIETRAALERTLGIDALPHSAIGASR